MKRLLFIFGFLVFVNFSFSQSQVWVDGYVTSNGKVVEGYYRTVSDNTATNNNSYYGNTNPTTGTTGTQQLYQNTTPTEDRTLYTGPKGGTFYVNPTSGNKVYVKTR